MRQKIPNTTHTGSVKYIPANAICLTCGTTKEHPVTAFCKNGHDNWLQIEDDINQFTKAADKFNKPVHLIRNAIIANKDLVPFKKEAL